MASDPTAGGAPAGMPVETSDPNLDSRKRIGWQVLLYLLVTTAILYAAKRLVWSGVKH